jgi:hypothetical protein
LTLSPLIFGELLQSVRSSADTKANMLCFANVEDAYEITYIPRESFIRHLPNQDVVYSRQGKLFVADLAEQGVVYSTHTHMHKS